MKSLIMMFCMILVISTLANANYLDDLNTGECPSSRANYDELGADQWNFYPCQCTSYVAWKLNQNDIVFNNYYENEHWGNANNWDYAASSAGISQNNTPQVGDVAVWDEGDFGHVAYVESVNENGTVNVSEYNWSLPLGYGTRNSVSADHYIHFGGNIVEVYDFWVRDPNIPIYTSSNFDAQFKLRNNGTENITFLAVAMAVHDSNNNFIMDMMYQGNVSIEAGGIFESGFTEVDSMPNTSGDYFIVVKVQEEDETWRVLQSQPIVIIDTNTPTGDCVDSISLNQSVSGSWESSCESTHRSGSYAKYYTFTLSSTQEIVIDLQSLTDTYLFLLNGSGQNGSEITHNDDSNGTLNSQIIRTLSSGTYTIEATTYSSGSTGSFEVSISANDAPPPSGDCEESIEINQSVSGEWEAGCASTHRSGRYAKYYTFTLSSNQEVTIDLESSVDTYMFLLSGSGQYGSVIEYNDDGGSGYNSRITRALSAGTYTVEATTYSSGSTGSFEVSVQ